MPKNQNTFEKLQRERAKKLKAQEKRERREKKKENDSQEDRTAPADRASSFGDP